MQYVIDVILALLLVYFTVRGFKRGFFKTVLSAGRLVLAILLTVALGSRVSQWIDRQYVNPPVYEKVHTKLAAMAADAGAQSDEFFRQLGEQYGAYLDKDELNRQAESNASSLDQMVEQYSTSISNTVSGAISTVVGYLLTFAAAFAVLALVTWLIGKLTRLPLLKQCDKIAGLVLGLVSGFFAVSLLATVFWASLYATDSLAVYDKTYLLKFFKEMKIFQFILDKIL